MVSNNEALSSFVASAPPGELANVTNALSTIVGDDGIVQQLEPAYKKYNEGQFATVKLPGSSKEVLVSEFNELGKGRYFDVESQTSFQFDHTTQKASSAQSFVLEGAQAELTKSLLKSLSAHAEEHYPASVYGVYPIENDSAVAIAVVANKYSPNNFWNGRWRSAYEFNPATSSLTGQVHVDVHYYEDGNVRLLTSKPFSLSVSSSSASEIIRQIASAEKKYQEDLNRAFGQLSEGAFKGLRRQLPITRQKIEWEKISGYRVSCEMMAQGSIQPCSFVKTRGGCRRGEACRFSHHAASTGGSPSGSGRRGGRTATNNDSRSPIEKQLVTWLYQTRLKTTGPLSAPIQVENLINFCQGGRDLAYSEDDGVLQRVITGLSSDGGLQRIKELGEHLPVSIHDADSAHFGSSMKEKAVLYFTKVVLPFFETIIHPNADAFVMLEPDVGRIYTALYGINGRRILTIFKLVVDVFTSKWYDVDVTQENDTGKVISTCVEVLGRTADINQTMAMEESIKELVKRFLDEIETRFLDGHHVLLPGAQKILQRLVQRFELASTIPELKPPVPRSSRKATFELSRDMPGELSSMGPRHDNDFANISRIKIMPTAQEIASERHEYLPPLDSSEWHLPGIQGLADRHFRLLRKDTVGQLSDAIQDFLKSRNLRSKSMPARSGLRLHTWQDVRIQAAYCNKFVGPVLQVSFEQSSHVVELPRTKRNDWWASGKRLNADALVCLLDAQGMPIFCSVVTPQAEVELDGKSIYHRLPVISQDEEDNTRAIVHLTLVAEDGASFGDMIESLGKSTVDTIDLVEFPGVLLPSFLPTLKALQLLSQKAEIPFADMLVPDMLPSEGNFDVPPPAYATKAGFKFDLSCLTKSAEPLQLSVDEPFDVRDLYTRTDLDEAQALALRDMLTRSIGIVQGPPGCGKSFIGVAALRVLLANQEAANLGPIICVCYTNHALDQLLEHLLDHDVKNLIRVGSRSKSERLADVNLRAVSKKLELTKEEKKRRWELHGSLESHHKKVNYCLKKLSGSERDSIIEEYLFHQQPHHHSQLFDNEDEEGWEIQGFRKKGPLNVWLGAHEFHAANSPSRSLNELTTANLWTMSKHERKQLYEYWVERQAADIPEECAHAINKFQEARANLKKIREQADFRCLQQAKVIGVTTSGVARNLDLLRRLRTKVLCVEEAAEVLEGHVLMTILPSVEHMILIGDHLQLRPQIQNYELSQESARGKKYSLDMSLFERLVAPPSDMPAILMPFNTIETQRRMSPCISRLIRNTLYPTLKDDNSVKSYPQVTGMKNRLHWFDHHNMEDGVDNVGANTMSKTNCFEVEMVAALVTHLVRQGVYHADEIAVLTPYLGQLVLLKKRLAESQAVTLNDRDQDEIDKAGLAPEGQELTPVAKTTLLRALRVATIDNFQGEEARVVVVSLVRSNPEKKCGFLKTSNRINVLLSRAQHGMYIIGNADTSGTIRMWRDVIDMLKSESQISEKLELQCERHPETQMSVQVPDDFLVLSPEGGCSLRCIQRLTCGHSCPDRCHSPIMHSVVKCLQQCLRLKAGCDHSCPKPCWKACDEKCLIPLTNLDVTLPCGHHKTALQCWEAQDPRKVLCKTRVSKTVPGCGHLVNIPCHEDVTTPKYKCEHECGENLPCGHGCRRRCRNCRVKKADSSVTVNHGSCRQPCGRAFSTCEHTCKELCHPDQACSPCQSPCQVRCSHSQCQRLCSEPCAPCAEEVCASRCPHGSCTAPCSAPCDWLPCSQRCDKTLTCGHRCKWNSNSPHPFSGMKKLIDLGPSVCGELCPDSHLCQACGSEDVQEMMVDYIENLTYREIDLDEEPCISPPCGHLITLTSMDGYMDMSSHYETDIDGAFTAIKASADPFSSKELKTCPKCRGSLRSLSRYGRIVRRAHLDEATKRFSTWARQMYLPIAEKLNDEQEKLLESNSKLHSQHVSENCELMGDPLAQLSAIKAGSKASSRYIALLICHRGILSYIQRANETEMPFARMCEVVEARRRLRGSDYGEAFNANNSVVTSTYRLQGVALRIRCEIAILSDYISMATKTSDTGIIRMNLEFSQNRADCQRLIDDATSAKDPVRQTEGHIFMANLYALELPHCGNEAANEVLKIAGQGHISSARDLCKIFPGTTRFLPPEIDTAERALTKGFFNTPLSAAERREVLQAMAGELRGTGHWYTCVNGHPFSIGECGMPMQEARCPTCGERIGGRNHEAVEGVRRADDLDRELANLHLDR